MPRSSSRTFLAVIAAVLFGLGAPASLFAQPAPVGAPVPTWAPNGAVNALALDGDMLYAGGSFDQVGLRTGAFAIVDPADATAFTTTAAVHELVRQVIADGVGGWYVITEPNLAGAAPAHVLHILPTGERDPAWTPPTFDSTNIWTIAADGARVFVGGFFQLVNGAPRQSLVALDGASGAVLPWSPRLVVTSASVSPTVSTMAALQGRLYVSGFFDEAGGALRSRFAILDTTTGDALPGTLTSAGSAINEIRLTPTRVYLQGTCLAGGSFICAYSSDLTPLAGWSYPASYSTIAVGPTAIYTVEPSLIGPIFGSKIVALDPDTGVHLPWTPPELRGESGASVYALEVSAGTLYVGGAFSQVNGQSRFRLAAVEATTGALLPWAPLIGAEVRSLVATASGLAVGGRFASVGGVARRNLVALDLRTGQPGKATPDLGYAVTTLLRLGDVMVAGGERVLGQTGPDLTAFYVTTGALHPWALESNGAVNALVSDGQRLYIGGRFSSISGALRLNLAAVDLQTAMLTSWSPAPDAPVFALASNGDTIFAAGAFNAVPGYGRPGNAAFSAATGELLSFSPAVLSSRGGRGFGFHRDRVLLGGEQPTDRASLPAPLDWVDRVSGAVVEPPSSLRMRVMGMVQFGLFIYAVGANPLGQGQLAVIYAPSGLAQVTGTTLGYYSRAVAVNADYVALGGGLAASLATTERSIAVFRSPRAGAPRRITAAVTGSTVTLDWQPGVDPPATAFLVEVGTAAAATDVGVFNVGLTRPVVGTLPAGTFFTRVRGVGANGPGTASSEVIVTTPATATAPLPPGTLTASASAGMVTLSWGAAAGNATTYAIEAGTVSGVMNIGALPTGTLDTTWSTTAPPGTYFVRVRAANAFGVSGPTNEVKVVVP